VTALAELKALKDAVRNAKLRATPSRIALLGLLRSLDHPISHADAVAQLRDHDWDPATIYRNLSDFVAAGIARRTDVGDHIWRFELIRDPHAAAAHPHFVCTECGAVECLPKLGLVLPRTNAPKAVRQRKIEVQVRGLCDACC
jgi:Fur family ferric uptake transcriptional regulator